MIEAHDDVVSAALSLPPELRAELAERLLSSLDNAEQAGIDAAWAEEAERRIEQLDQGKVNLIPGDALIIELQTRCK
jgi:putative addiction module component (TIGR02574 family)